MSDPVKGSIASKLAEQVAMATVASKEDQATLDFAEEGGAREEALASILGVREPIIVTPHGAEPGRFRDRRRCSRDGRVVIDARRLEHGEVAPEERAQLIALLEALLTKTRHARLKL